jgi:hypothetical protein
MPRTAGTSEGATKWRQRRPPSQVSVVSPTVPQAGRGGDWSARPQCPMPDCSEVTKHSNPASHSPQPGPHASPRASSGHGVAGISPGHEGRPIEVVAISAALQYSHRTTDFRKRADTHGWERLRTGGTDEPRGAPSSKPTPTGSFRSVEPLHAEPRCGTRWVAAEADLSRARIGATLERAILVAALREGRIGWGRIRIVHVDTCVDGSILRERVDLVALAAARQADGASQPDPRQVPHSASPNARGRSGYGTSRTSPV